MKRLLIAVVVAMALTMGNVSVASAQQTSTSTVPGTVQAQSGVVSASNPSGAIYFNWGDVGHFILCGAQIGFGFVGVGAVTVADPPTAFTWVGFASGALDLSIIGVNHTCAYDSGLNHIGYRQTCWNHFAYVSPISGKAVFVDNDFSAPEHSCRYDPPTADRIYCNYIVAGVAALVGPCTAQQIVDFLNRQTWDAYFSGL